MASAHLKTRVKIAFASGTDELNARLIEKMREPLPWLPLFVVSEFSPDVPDVTWVPYRANRGLLENWARLRAVFADKNIRLAGVMLVPNVPYRRLRLLAFLLSPIKFLAYNENLDCWMIRPRCAWTIFRHGVWRTRNFLRWHFGAEGTLARRDWQGDFWYVLARLSGYWHAGRLGRSGFRAPDSETQPATAFERGISVIIPSRNGKELLAAQLPGIVRELPSPAEIIVVDNGSEDGTAYWLNTTWPQIKVVISEEPLSFAAAINRGIARARCARICLLNNDMLLDSPADSAAGFFTALDRAFAQVPDLFCATAQIRFAPGARREETGKAVIAQTRPTDFPIRCDDPIPGEDLSYVLYGSGGCSLYDAEKLNALGGIDETYAPAYVEDLDLGYRAWQRGWPSVYVAGAVVEHRHRATTSRYYSEQELTRVLERNYLQFLARAVAGRTVFRQLWRQATRRLWLLRDRAGLRMAFAVCGHPVAIPPLEGLSETSFLALTNGSVSVFPGHEPSGKPRVLVASPYLPFPLSHGGAVRMYNLMRRAAAEFDQVLVVFSEMQAAPSAEVLEMTVETVVVRRIGSHSPPFNGRPDVVEEFASPSFYAALEQSVRKWRPALAQLEFTQMAQYAAACAPAKTLLIEHDITFDLYEQLLAMDENWELRRQLGLWRQFETAVWREVGTVVTMSEKDRSLISVTADSAARPIALPNGVDLNRFQPSSTEPDPHRMLFIGSFAHLPNLLAAEFFVNQAWPLLISKVPDAVLHLITGHRHEYHMARFADRVKLQLTQPGLEVEGFVSDVRPAYHRAAVVIAPLPASAGTNIKILEAMAMGKAIVSTPAGVNGLDLSPGRDFVLTKTAEEMAEAIYQLLRDPKARKCLEIAARQRVEDGYGWDQIALRQAAFYRELL